MKQVGVPHSHESARGHVTGQAKYVDDLWPRVAGVVHLWPVCVPQAHAQIMSIDISRAAAAPGVAAVLTAADVRGENDVGPVRHDEPLFPSRVCFHGQAIVWVAAETEEQARSAAALVDVRCQPLPAITTIAAAIEAGSYQFGPERLARGDAAQALLEAEQRLSGELLVGGQEHFYLETQAALAWVDEAGALFVQSSTQHPSETQEVVARVTGLARHDVIVQCLRMGGAFGGKETQANQWAAVAALATLRLGRPARVRLNRYNDMVLTGKRHPFLGKFEVGFDRSGRIHALALELYSDGGYSLDLSAPVLFRAMFHADNCYQVEHMSVTGRVCRTHLASNTAFRGFGGPQGMLMIEDVIDRVSRQLGLPPHEVRQKNFYRPGDTSHYGQPIRDADRIQRIWSELGRSSDFDARWRAIEQFNAHSRNEKRGLAMTPVKFGISFTTSHFNQAGALVLIYKDGSVQVNHGGTEMGQGLHTKMLQIAADALGVPLSSLRIMPTRTDKIPNTSATAASSGSDLNGAAVFAACTTLRERLADVAARHFAVAPEQLTFDDGIVFPSGRVAEAVPFAFVVNLAYEQSVPLFASGFYRTPDLSFDKATGKGKPFHYYAYGAAVCEVEVDGFTGQYGIRRVDILHDVGSSLSPLVDRGQVEGAFIQGLGWLTTEELTWNREGALTSSGASTYKLPSLGECPAVFNVALLERAAEPGVVYGSKAVGEPPFMLAFSVREALRAAIAAFAEPRVAAPERPGSAKGPCVELASPATPEAVYWAIEAVRERVLTVAEPHAAQ
ncbi:MAG TPA: xanthine dehydrogenase molybdopterin binding subunit [Polyangiaceae bacterium]|nr:xanthine dehydrogenase molybdopterin binding subunit [Polyangiaceae bacterium]